MIGVETEGCPLGKLKAFIARFDALAEYPMEEYGFSRAWLLWDYAWAWVTCRCSFTDYFLFRFYHLNRRGRKEYICLWQMRDFHRKNPARSFADFEEKDRFLDRFSDFVHRDWIGRKVRSSREEFDAFCQSHERCILKRRTDFGGHGAELCDLTAVDRDALYERMVRDDLIAEELVRQCPQMAALHPDSVNTVRVLTIKGKIVAATLRQGSGGSFMDNGTSGGVFAAMDPSSGIVVTPGVRLDTRQALRNPTTGVVIPGFRVPMWEETKQMIARAVQVAPETLIIGWDVAYTDDGPILIEGNAYPGVQILQGGYRGLARDWRRAMAEN